MAGHSLRAGLVAAATLMLAGAWQGGCEAVEDEPSGVGPFLEGPGFNGIVGGQPTNYQSWKGVIGIYGASGPSQGSLCTGTLIDPEVVLSAGHCVYSTSSSINYLNTPGNLQIVGGADLTNGMQVISKVAKIEKHPTWDGNVNGDGIDLSLLHLTKQVTSVESYLVRVAPAPANGTPGKIAGYGASTSSGQGLGIHRVGDTTCLDVQTKLIELGNPAGTCQGDSGGPLFTEQGGQWTVTGVTSAGKGGGCDPMQNNLDVNVVSYRDWINDVVIQWTGHGLPGGDGDADGDSDSDADGDSDGDADTSGDGGAGGDAGADGDDTADDGSGRREGDCGCSAPGTPSAPDALFGLVLFFL